MTGFPWLLNQYPNSEEQNILDNVSEANFELILDTKRRINSASI